MEQAHGQGPHHLSQASILVKKAPRTIRNDAPSRIVAADFLRQLARDIGRPLKIDPQQRAADFRLIADCIEGKVKWAKSGAHSMHERQKIYIHARLVESRRPAGMSVGMALDLHAKNLARDVRLTGPDDHELARGWIETARKHLRKLDRSAPEI